MGAWAELVNARGDDDWLSLCEAALLEVQRETLHRAAEKIRKDPLCTQPAHRDYFADLVDPAVTT